MKIYLRDHNEGTHTVWKKALCAAGISLEHNLAVIEDGYYGNETPLCVKAADACVFLHSQTYRQQWENGFKEGTFLGHLVVVSTQGGKSLSKSGCDRVHLCFWTPSHFEETNKGNHRRLRKWIEQIKSDDFDKVDWSLLQPAPTEQLYALRLLCEAWDLNKGREEDVHNGYTLKAPVIPNDWFNPFGQTALNNSATEAIASGMVLDDAKNEVRTFLSKIVHRNSVLDEDVQSLRQVLDQTIAELKT